jgi:deazaflavin-dependent oxidoreductase (nitroreductase family)
MPEEPGTPLIWRLMKVFKPLPIFAHRFLPGLKNMVLVLTTTGRNSGLARQTPLQYERIGDLLYIGSARGVKADWVQNIIQDPCVSVLIKGQQITGIARVVDDPEAAVDFLELRLKRHPWMMKNMLRIEGITSEPDRKALEDLARRIALIEIILGRNGSPTTT